MTTTLPPICLWCVHFDREESMTTCDAFPDGIPQDILTASADHMEPREGDHGIQFELRSGEEFPSAIYPVSERPWNKTGTLSSSGEANFTG